jgi:dolichol-phosphate mannosyltransferase
MAGEERTVKSRPPESHEPIRLLSIVIPTRNEEDAITSTVEHLYVELRLHNIEHEIVVIDDGSTDSTWDVLARLRPRIPTLNPARNPGENGYGRAVHFGFDHSRGDAVVVMMADESDDSRDVVRYWHLLNEGWDAVFGSRFVRGGGVIDYPFHKLFLNRLANWFIRLTFHVPFTDFTNAFKAYRREAIDGCRPLLSPHFNLNIELPLKVIVRGYSWTSMPITWRNRRSGISKLRIGEMGSRYFFIACYCWFEKYFSRGDYRKPARSAKVAEHLGSELDR